jgi:hypothetical protein
VSDHDELSAADLESWARANDLVPVPPELVPRVLKLLGEHRAAMRRVADARLDLHEVFPAHVFRA